MNFGKTKYIHIIGIGGAGMSAIAELLLINGYSVSGSDLKANELTKRLVTLGAKISIGHSRENIVGPDVVTYSSAIDVKTNSETLEALAKNIPTIKRDAMLGEIMKKKDGICIAGSHGKTTTTNMVGIMLSVAKLDPTMIMGGYSNYFDSSAIVGEGKYFVIEADEFDRTFLKLSPNIAVITNIDIEHLETYGSKRNIIKAFTEFSNKTAFFGIIIGCIDNQDVRKIMKNINRRTLGYGFGPDADIRAKNIIFSKGTTFFHLLINGKSYGEIRLPCPGEHNVLNALASICVGLEIGLNIDTIKDAINSFETPNRRFSIKHNDKDYLVVDDYAHHPSEVMASISAGRRGWPDRKLVVVFQPHLYSRTRDFANEYARVLSESDIVFITDIFPSREKQKDFPSINHNLIIKKLKDFGYSSINYYNNQDKLFNELRQDLYQKSLIIFMGAGDIALQSSEFVRLINLN